MMTTGTRTSLALALSALLLSTSCHVVVGDPDDYSSGWLYYCDDYGCYRCNSSGCGFPEDYLCEWGDCGSCPAGVDCGFEPLTCAVMLDCDRGQVCLSGVCRPATGACHGHADCGQGAYCSDGQCMPSDRCSVDGACGGMGDGFSCDEQRGCCVPGPTGPQACATSSTCGAGGLCVDGLCGICSGDCGGGKTCELDRHCGEQRACVDGQCTNRCPDTADCGSNQQCNTTLGVCVADPTACGENGECGAGNVCVDGVCHADCTETGVCDNGADLCSDAFSVGQQEINVCVPEHAAQPECSLSRDCTDNEQCVNGVCRTTCGEAKDCETCDDGPVCGMGGFCMTAAESSPECKANAECGPGEICRDAHCVAL